MSVIDYIPFLGNDPYEDLGPALQKVRQDHDALILFPYDDGTFFIKPGDFDKELLGGKGGYETPDEDKIILDGAGQPKKDLMGVPMLLACDPTEHSAAVEPMKAHIAHKKDLGEWLKVDRRGNILEAGASLERVDAEGTDTADDTDTDAGPEHDGPASADLGPVPDIDIGLENTLVEEESKPGETLDATLKRLEQETDDIQKLYDFSTPAAPEVAADGGVEVEEATHVAVDQSKAADLLPRTMSTEEINVALDKARMQEHDEGKIKELITYGAVLGAVGTLISAMVLGGMFFLIG